MEPNLTKTKNTVGYRMCSYRVLEGVRAEGPKRYALSTENYVDQDGWVLLASGFRFHSAILPILYNHGWEDDMPLGRWSEFAREGGDLIASPLWAERLTDEELRIKDRAEQGLLMTSIRFVVSKYRTPTEDDRRTFGIPPDAPYAGIAEEWSAPEASFTPTPADGKAGPRMLQALHARAAGMDIEVPSKEDLISISSQLSSFRELLDKGFANAQSSLTNISTLLAVQTQRALSNTDNNALAGVTAASGSQMVNANGRRDLYNSDTLGISAVMEELRQKLPGGKPTISNDTTDRSGGAGSGATGAN